MQLKGNWSLTWLKLSSKPCGMLILWNNHEVVLTCDRLGHVLFIVLARCLSEPVKDLERKGEWSVMEVFGKTFWA